MMIPIYIYAGEYVVVEHEVLLYWQISDIIRLSKITLTHAWPEHVLD